VAAQPKATRKETQSDLINDVNGLGGEEIVTYNLFLTDAFGGGAGLLDVQGHVFQNEGSGVPETIDGHSNDDSYRRSRRLLHRSTYSDVDSAAIAHIRENSLARQIDEKKDQPGVIRLIRRLKSDELNEAAKQPGPVVPWVNLIPPNTKFLLETVQESRQEKVQIIDTFGEWVAFFFGRRPEVYNYSGTLINSSNHDWKNEFQFNYDHFLRGSQAVKHRATMILQYDDVMVEGYMLNSSIQMSGVTDKSVPFTFSLLVINRSQMNPRRQMGLRFLRSGPSIGEGQFYNDLQGALDLTERDTDDMQTFLLMREYFSGNYIPAAGKFIHRAKNNNIESETSVQPGQKGGSKNPKPVPASFSAKTSGSILERGVTLLE